MIQTLLNIVLPVFIVAAVGFAYGKRQTQQPALGFINQANILLFCPALIFSALLENPINPFDAWPLVVAGVLIFVLPGIALKLLPHKPLTGAGYLVPGMFRNTGNIGIPLMVLAYGKAQMGAIVILFVMSNIMYFSLGLYLLSQGKSHWEWLKNPNVWAAILGVLIAPWHAAVPQFVLVSTELLGQIAIPLMLFTLGVRLSQGRFTQVQKALHINVIYLAVSAALVPLVLWMLPLTPEWARLVALSLMLPPAVMNYLMCEQYQASPDTVANVVLLGNLMSVITIPLVVWATLTFI